MKKLRCVNFSLLLLFGISCFAGSAGAASWRDVWSPMQQLKIPTPQYEHDTVSLYPAENNNVRIWVQPSYFSSPVSRVRSSRRVRFGPTSAEPPGSMVPNRYAQRP